MNEDRIGSDLDSLLDEQGMLAEVEAVAMKRVLAWQMEQAMHEQHLTKAALARRMRTSRTAVARLLDPESPSVTLLTLERAAHVLGKKVRIEVA